MKCSEIFRRISGLLQDTQEPKTWPDTSSSGELSLADLLNTAMQTVVQVRPEAYAVAASIQVVAGRRQPLPADALSLLDIRRDDGSSVARCSMSILEAFGDGILPSATIPAGIINFAYDQQVDQRSFLVCPAVAAAASFTLAARVSKSPMITSGEDDFPIEDTYAQPCISAVLYLIHISDNEDISISLAQAHVQAFSTAMGSKSAADALFRYGYPRRTRGEE